MQKLTKKTKADLDDQLEDIIFFKLHSKNALEADEVARHYYWERCFYASLIRLYNDYGLMPWARSIEDMERDYAFYDKAHRDGKLAHHQSKLSLQVASM